MTILQVLNGENNPASTEITNPSAIFINEEQANEFINYLVDECGLDREELKIVPFSGVPETGPKLEFSAETIATRCKEVEMPLSPKECKSVAEILEATMDTISGIHRNTIDEAIVYAHSASVLKWEPIKYRGVRYWLRVVESDEEGVLFVAPCNLYDHMTYDYCGERLNKDAEDLDSQIYFYANDTEISVSDKDLLKLILDEQSTRTTAEA